jgi:hypothetical protein
MLTQTSTLKKIEIDLSAQEKQCIVIDYKACSENIRHFYLVLSHFTGKTFAVLENFHIIRLGSFSSKMEIKICFVYKEATLYESKTLCLTSH